MQQKPKRVLSSRGFTILELIVSISIIVVITAVVAFNQKDFDDQISLANLATDIEVEIRQAQVYGISVREFAPNTNEFNISYGVSFNLLTSFGGGNNFYVSFADRPLPSQNNQYDGIHSGSNCQIGGSSECLNFNNILRGNIISDLCVTLNNNTQQCFPNIGRFDVMFQRPNPDAVFTFFNPSGTVVPFPGHKGARIVITSPKGKTQSIHIYKTGQISIQ
ncbi:MAG: hypothetical protein A2653_00215 [Candidatus Zambryskibacteria bacterium RIFCSPHIGHO2_01_FULL_43_25]|uniref:Prepilin-type N-terminal cleavage/methylation domain-containing protein n=1 Tax=Candidatus Zambryskibacteria bacterium RIFCSPLOWO2_01_FULL_45_21 TaxID=1802761 RepID=A0A1G2U4Q1_9BACT|nr:MAG: hypothetical protein A2653_00215 [Candidatus Zambryskibacteria bacterium RIFCSPHIGHO2_01_FULL_43_25]OHB00658.1 MAG: hypothetical protein A3E94_03470 [Candidatus Zambryskibacteria bacterium RIFCSPHIGHO2_12_FULL_44_12b]OHB04473.1 MAG: hypothetical protein A3B14_03510 [Candidatus Zambryskibacteria bacterium RIFCSPLOWO2_01_FULL_45_21]